MGTKGSRIAGSIEKFSATCSENLALSRALGWTGFSVGGLGVAIGSISRETSSPYRKLEEQERAHSRRFSRPAEPGWKTTEAAGVLRGFGVGPRLDAASSPQYLTSLPWRRHHRLGVSSGDFAKFVRRIGIFWGLAEFLEFHLARRGEFDIPRQSEDFHGADNNPA